MNRIQLGKKLKSYREETHLTQEQLADILSMDPKKISRIERGVQYPEEFYLRALGQFSSLDIDEIEKDMLEATHSDVLHRMEVKSPSVSNEELMAELTSLRQENQLIIRALSQFLELQLQTSSQL